MTLSRTILFALCAALLLPACLGGSKKKRDVVDNTVGADQQASATTGPVTKLEPEAPGPDFTVYVCDLTNSQGHPVAGVRTMLLSHAPEGAYIKEPRRKSVLGTYKSPRSGRVFFKTPSNDEPKTRYLWFGGQGIEPFIKQVENVASGSTFRHTQVIDIVPTATFVINDHVGDLVADAIVTFNPTAKEASKFGSRGVPPNYMNTLRSDDLGEVRFSRPPGEYQLIATKPNGTSRLTKTIQWDGNLDPIHVNLPERTPGR